MVKAYWWKEVENFGDALAPLLLNHFANLKTEWAPISQASVVSIGSLLEHVPPLWGGYILGSGRLIEDSRLHLVQYRSGVTAKIILVRGPLSAKGIPGSFGLGDPGILANELVGPQEKKWDLGIIPHWSDRELAPRFTQIIKAPSTTKVIHPNEPVLQVLRDIGACRRIVTSSLHGMIVADAFGIPRRFEVCPEMWRDGGTFKFHDYSASIACPLETGKMQEPNRCKVEDVKFVVYDAYCHLSGVLGCSTT